MDENQKAALRKFFSVSTVVCFAAYLVFMAILLFSLPVSTSVFVCLIFVAFSLFIIQDAVNTRAEELGDIGRCGLLSLPFITIFIGLYYAVSVYYMKLKQQDDMLWVVIALYDSILFDKSFRALHKLK